MPFRAKAWSFCAAPLPYLAFKGRQGALDDLAERCAVHKFAGFVALPLGFDDLVKTVMRALRRTVRPDFASTRRFGGCGRAPVRAFGARLGNPFSSDTCSRVSGGTGC